MNHHGKILYRDDNRNFSIVDCTTCGYAHVIPLPDENTVAALYRGNYWSGFPSYSAEVEEDAAWHDAVLDDRLARIATQTPGRQILDVGCGPGLFLNRAIAKGWHTAGCEPDPVMAEQARARGANPVCGTLGELLALDLGPFDAIHMFEVLEHVVAPEQLVRDCRALLKPGGVLYVGVPNDFNAWQTALQACGSSPWWVSVPHHLNYFSHDSLRRLCERSGFVAEESFTSFPMELFALMGQAYAGNHELGRTLHSRRKLFEHRLRLEAPQSLDLLYRALAQCGLGRTAEWLVRRPATEQDHSGQ